MRSILLSTAISALLVTGAAHAGHANPWATADDDILMQNHDENLEQSVDTPGEDEMLGVMEQNARGKLDASLTSSAGGSMGPGSGAGPGSGMGPGASAGMGPGAGMGPSASNNAGSAGGMGPGAGQGGPAR